MSLQQERYIIQELDRYFPVNAQNRSVDEDPFAAFQVDAEGLHH
jgi:hypothetical protein